jgi:hypothetical protein
MSSPDYLSLSDVEELLARLGVPAARQNLARGLRQFPLPGVDPPRGNGQAWRVRPHALLDLLSVALWRRERRRLAPRGLAPGSPHRFQLDAAERLLADKELARLVPRGLKKTALERQAARRRRREEERRRLDEIVRRVLGAEDERDRRERERQARWEAEVDRREEARRHENAMTDCYCACAKLVREDLGLRIGPGCQDRPEFARYRRDWPPWTERPGWWRPPPGMYELALAERERTRRFGEPEPDWRRFLVAPYEPGRPWPWRGPEADAAAADAAAS